MIRNRIQLYLFRRKWRRNNKHNTTVPANLFFINHVEVGNYTYGTLHVVDWGSKSKLRIGNYVSIAENVCFLLNADHYTNHISTFPFKNKITSGEYEATSKGDIVIDDDVWIGYGATILSGVHIAQGAVIAAGAVVTKDVDPYTVVGGVPANTIKKRFSQRIISKLEEINYEKLTSNIIKQNIDDLYLEIDDSEEIIDEKYQWLLKD